MPNYDALFRFARRPREMLAALRGLPEPERRDFADQWDQHDQELEDWLEQNPGLELGTALPSTLVVEQAGVVGSGPEASPWNHVHETVADAPLDLVVNDTLNEGDVLGTATQRLRFARATHRHGVPRGTPGAVGGANAAGSTGLFADAGHVHEGATIGHTHTAIHGVVRRTASTAQTFVNGAEAVVEFDAVVENAGLTWDIAGFEWEILTAGVYIVTSSIKWLLNAACEIEVLSLHVIKNRGTGSELPLEDDHREPFTMPSLATRRPSNHVSTAVRLAVGDTISATAIQQNNLVTVAGDFTVLQENRNSPVMTITWIGP